MAKFVDLRFEEDQTALHVAANHGSLELVNLLLPEFQSSLLDYQDKLGRTALFLSSMQNHEVIVKELLTAGADESIADNDGSTPLSVAPKKLKKSIRNHLIGTFLSFPLHSTFT